MMHKFIAILTALAVLSACGGATEIGVTRTFHSQPGDWNEVHPSVRHENGHLMAAAYHNSEGRLSFAVGAVARRDVGPVSAFCEGGLVTGYSRAPVMPMARCAADYGVLRVSVFPEIKNEGGLSFGLGVGTTVMEF